MIMKHVNIIFLWCYPHAALFVWRTRACETEHAVNTLRRGKQSKVHTPVRALKQTETLISNSLTICFNI